MSSSSGSMSTPSPPATLTKTHHIKSVQEVRDIINEAETHVNQVFYVCDNTSLEEGRKLWKVVSAYEGGHGVLANVELLASKEEAFLFVQEKLGNIKRLVANTDNKFGALVAVTASLEEVLAKGGPAVPTSFDPKALEVPPPYIDLDEAVEDEKLQKHIDRLRGLVLQNSPGSPLPEGYRSASAVTGREALQLRALTEFNLAFLKLKLEALSTLRGKLLKGVADLEQKFLVQPTNMGCGSGDFISFQDLPMLSGDRKGNTW